MKIKKFIISITQNTVYEIKPSLFSALEAKKPKYATKIIATPVKIKT